jgi:hypothetical protein
VRGEDLANRHPPGKLAAHERLARDLLLGQSHDLLGNTEGHDDDAVIVGENEIAVRNYDVPAADIPPTSATSMRPSESWALMPATNVG